MEEYVSLMMSTCVTISTFNLWMLRIGFDTFATDINFVNNNWVSPYYIIGLFEVPNAFGVVLVKIVKPFIIQFQLVDKVLVYVKNKDSNLNALENVLSITTSCKLLKLEKPFDGTYFDHVMSKVCQYATIYEKVCVNEKSFYQRNLGDIVIKGHNLDKEKQEGVLGVGENMC